MSVDLLGAFVFLNVVSKQKFQVSSTLNQSLNASLRLL